MNGKFVYSNLNIGTVVRITTKEAVGIIGKIKTIDTENDGLILESLKDKDMLEKLENVMDYDEAYLPITDIKYIFTLDLKSKK